MAKARNSRLDGVKLLLIVLVVIGHCIEPSRYTNTVSGGLYSVIYSFHMPLFVLLSGYFAKVLTFKEWKTKGLRFLETFLVIMIPQFLFYRSWHVFINPENSGWYLMSLVWWYGLLLFIKKTKVENIEWGGVLIISVIISITVFAFPFGNYGRLLSFNRTIQMFPFFYGGYLLKNKGVVLPYGIKKSINIIALLLVGLLFVFLLLHTSRLLHELEFYNTDAWTISNNWGTSVMELLGYRVFLMLCAVVISMLIIENFKIPVKISLLGESTMVIYVIQGIFAHLIPSIAPSNLYIELGIAFFIVLVSIVLIKHVDCRYITNPITTCIELFKERNNEKSK